MQETKEFHFLIRTQSTVRFVHLFILCFKLELAFGEFIYFRVFFEFLNLNDTITFIMYKYVITFIVMCSRVCVTTRLYRRLIGKLHRDKIHQNCNLYRILTNNFQRF